jgi:malate/lactate dehydrogenase
VKSDQRSTLHPIVEAVVKVAEAVALDRQATLTVSTLDPDSPEGLYYSVPCTVGRNGVVHRHVGVLSQPKVRIQMEACRDGLLDCLRSAGEA